MQEVAETTQSFAWPSQHIGRKSDFSEAIAIEICRRIAANESLTHIVKDEHMPSINAVYEWLAKVPAFGEAYARARERRADTIFEETLLIPDTEQDVNRARLKVDTRKWFLARLFPTRYGEQQPVNNTQITVNVAQHAQTAEAKLRQLAARHDDQS